MSEVSEFYIPTDQEVESLDPDVRATLAAALLRGVRPGRQPLALFEQFCRLSVATTVEVVPIRAGDDTDTEVWLGQRSDSDRWWPGKWVLPGVVVLSDDTHDEDCTLTGPIARLFASELEGIQPVGDMHQLPTQFRFDGRGNEVTTQYWTEVATDGDLYPGRFFNVANLRREEPAGGVLEEGWLTINRAVADYTATRTHL